MIAFILGLGPSISEYKNGGNYSIGVNDVFGKGVITDRLIVVNSFKKQPDRLKTILNSRPKDGLYSQIGSFAHHPNYKHIGPMQRWKGNLKPEVLYSSVTSTFIAISMAHNMGFKEIVLYGVDFHLHKTVKNNTLKREVMQYESFCKALSKLGTKVYLGTDFGALKEILPIWIQR